MACQEPNTTLADEEISKNLEAVSDQKLSSSDISEKVHKPLFKVKSNLRELVKVGYVKIIDEEYIISSEGQRIYATLK